ncbi:MAG: chalcone isomerase family protein [Bdellovibrionia bacterium]
MSFSERQQVGGQTLVLNGVGFRKATIFKIQVYAAGLYLLEPSSHSAQIIKSREPKKILLKFLRSVGVKDIREAWEKNLQFLCESSCAAIAPEVQKFLASLEGMEKGGEMSYVFTRTHFQLFVSGQLKMETPLGAFSETLLKTWLGPKLPPSVNEDLKEGLLKGGGLG